MHILDVNVLVCAFRRESPDHKAFKAWLEVLLNGAGSFGVPDFVFCRFVRIVTNRRIYKDPSSIEEALALVDRVRESLAFVPLALSADHWQKFARLCRRTKARGNLIPDAYLAATAIERNDELFTADRGFGRWPGLRWRHPLDE